MIFAFNIRMIRLNGNESKKLVVDVGVESFAALVAIMNNVDHFDGVLQAETETGKLLPIGPISLNQNSVITARPWKERVKQADRLSDDL